VNQVLEQIGRAGIIPVVVLEKLEDAVPLAKAVSDGGLLVVEITFRTVAARESIAQIARALPKILIGAGTVLSTDQVDAALDAGARFIVSPGLNRKVLDHCRKREIPITPGVLTPTEIEAALDCGLEVVKFFPAEPAGGITYLKAVSAPYGNVRFIPTGGVDEKNLADYLKFSKVLACGGSWMVKGDLIAGKRFDEIREITARAVAQRDEIRKGK
jgi:2-dehydro-3-deoxyphosphogluconate aldolase / (4S)-4-hydroxy-2-oxoglutarate aldolase